MAMSQALRECSVIEDIVVLFRREGKECLKTEIAVAPKLKEVNGITKYKGNPFTNVMEQSMTLWDDILRGFDSVAINLRKITFYFLNCNVMSGFKECDCQVWRAYIPFNWYCSGGG